MLPVIEAFMAAYQLTDVTVVADAGMISDANKRAVEAAGLSFILGMRISEVPFLIHQWYPDHPGQPIPDGHIFTQPWPPGPNEHRRDQTIYYPSTGPTGLAAPCVVSTSKSPKPRKPSRARLRSNATGFIKLDGAAKSINRQLEAKARTLAGIKGYITNLDASAEFVIDAYHRLFQIEKSFRMSKHDLQARPIYHHKRESIEAHLTIVFAALAVSRWIEDTTGWSIKKFVRTARRYRTIQIQAGAHTFTAADPLPDDLRQALDHIHHGQGAH